MMQTFEASIRRAVTDGFAEAVATPSKFKAPGKRGKKEQHDRDIPNLSIAPENKQAAALISALTVRKSRAY